MGTADAPNDASDPERLLDLQLSRRRLLILGAGTAAYLTVRPHLAWAKHVDRSFAILQPWELPTEPPTGAIDTSYAMIGAAVLAPNQWNCQPWRFEVEGTTIRLIADPTRALPVNDPDRRGMMISLGTALENLLIAARAYGQRTKVSYFPAQAAAGTVAQISWSNGDQRRDRGLFGAIVERRTNRREFDGRGIFMQNRAQLIAQAQDGFRIHWLDDREGIQRIADLAHDAVHARVLDHRAEAEQFSWMRFGDDDRRRGDGVPVDALELGGPAKWFAGRYFNSQSWFLRFGAQSAGKQARSAFRSAGALALLTATAATEASWLIGGQVYERFALKATQLGIAHQPINAPIETESLRAEVLRRFGATGEEPLMLVRLGHAGRPAATPRRAVALVASFRNS
jgi:nitroreductase